MRKETRWKAKRGNSSEDSRGFEQTNEKGDLLPSNDQGDDFEDSAMKSTPPVQFDRVRPGVHQLETIYISGRTKS